MPAKPCPKVPHTHGVFFLNHHHSPQVMARMQSPDRERTRIDGHPLWISECLIACWESLFYTLKQRPFYLSAIWDDAASAVQGNMTTSPVQYVPTPGDIYNTEAICNIIKETTCLIHWRLPTASGAFVLPWSGCCHTEGNQAGSPCRKTLA